MAKKNNSKNILIEYLVSNSDLQITRDEIISNTGISKSRLSELINDLRSDGYDILTPNRSGTVQLNTSKSLVQNITPKDVRQWIILFSLSKLGAATYIELVCSILSIIDSTYLYDKIETETNYSDMDILEYLNDFNSAAKKDIDFYLPLPTFRKDLNSLINLGLVDKKRTMYKEGMHIIYSISEQSPSMLFESEDELYDFMMYYDNFKKSLSNNTVLDSLYSKISNIYDWESYDGVTHIYGKANSIDYAQLNHLNQFIKHPYKTKSLEIKYLSQKGELNLTINAGLLFHSVETNCFYLLCRNVLNSEIMQLRLDRMLDIKDSNDKNDYFRAAEVLSIYEEMFSGSYEPQKVHVKILFQNFGNIKEKLSSLNSKRKYSKLYEIEQIDPEIPHTIVYEDDIRGLSAFSRFIRSFGSSALVLEPLELKEALILSNQKVLENYEV